MAPEGTKLQASGSSLASLWSQKTPTTTKNSATKKKLERSRGALLILKLVLPHLVDLHLILQHLKVRGKNSFERFAHGPFGDGPRAKC